MAYQNSYFPVGYQPAQIYYPQQMQPQPQPQQQPQQQQAPVQQSGFVRVQSENDARMYPVAPGNSVTFIDDNAPYCYVKTMDFSQLDRPKFEKYRLVKEEEQPAAQPATHTEQVNNYATKTDVEEIWAAINEIKARPAPKKKIRQEEEYDDE